MASLWLLTYVALSRYLVWTLPLGLRSNIGFTTYLCVVHVLTACSGLFLLRWVSRRHPDLWCRLLPLLSANESEHGDQGARYVLWAVCLGPTLYVMAHAVGMAIAYRTLLAELAAYGARVVQQQSGALGRSAQADSLWVVVPFAVVVAPVAEEMLFRGALFGAVQEFFGPPQTSGIESQPVSIPGLKRRAGFRKAGAPLMAWLISSLIFGWMHADLSGGLGILRTASASVLGLACGGVRWASGSLAPALALHAAYNLTSLATLRGWLVFADWPTKYALPTSLLVLAPLVAALGWLTILLLGRRRGSVQAG